MGTSPDTVTAAFDQLDESLKLDDTERKQAIDLHNDVTETLKAAGVATGGFLQGSLARKTMIAPLRDIDKILLLNPDVCGEADTPDHAAQLVEKALRDAYPDADISIGKHSVTITLKGHTFTFDIVPAIDLGDDVLIIDTKLGEWKNSNTRQLITTISDRNKVCNGRFVRHARFAKVFGKHYLQGIKIPGLHLETIAYLAITTSMAHRDAFVAFLRKGIECFAPTGTYSDPTGVDTTLSSRIDAGTRAVAHAMFQNALAQAEAALKYEENGNHQAAIGVWCQLLGDDFPKPGYNKAVGTLATGGGLGVGGVLSKEPAVSVPKVRSWRPQT